MPSIQLREADRLEITVLVDNYTDLLLSDTPIVKRLRVPLVDSVLAEHGLACLVTAYAGDETHTILMDTGISGTCLNHNAALLGKSMAAVAGKVRHRIEDVETLVLSHGHFDHFSGLTQYLALQQNPVTMVAHPQVFAQRRVKAREDRYVDLPVLERAEMEAKGLCFDCRDQASTIAQGLMLLSGEVARVTNFETGSANMEAFLNGAWVTDPFLDDQALAVKLKGKGLVILGGCSHAGIVNTVEHLSKVSQTDQIHAVMGGFHLSGAKDELIEATVAAIKQIAPAYIVPMHCSGLKASHTFAAQMPDQFILNAAGTTYIF